MSYTSCGTDQVHKRNATITSASSEYKEDIGSGEKLHINKVEPASSSKMPEEIPSKEEPQQKLMTAQSTHYY